MKTKKSFPLSQADFDQIHKYLEVITRQKLTLPDLEKDSKSGVYRFSCCDDNITDFREQFHLHISTQNRSYFEKPYLDLKYLRIPQSMRRQKLGTRIITSLIKFLEGKGFKGINLVAKNRQAFLFWQSLGFQSVHGALMEYELDSESEVNLEEKEKQPLLSLAGIKNIFLSLLSDSEKVG